MSEEGEESNTAGAESSQLHDRLFKTTFSDLDNARGEFQAVLPAEITQHIDWDSLRVEPGSFVGPDASELRTDLLFSADLEDDRTYLYVLFEHQSTVDGWMPLRMLTYMVRSWQREREEGARGLSPIIPLVLHHGAGGWTGATRIAELVEVPADLASPLGRFVPDFELLIDDLTRVSESELRSRSMKPLGRLVIWAMRAVRVGPDESEMGLWRSELEAAFLGDSREALEQFIGYLLQVSHGEGLYAHLIESPDVSAGIRGVSMGLRKEWEEAAHREGVLHGRGRCSCQLYSIPV